MPLQITSLCYMACDEYNVHKLHQGDILKKGCSLMINITTKILARRKQHSYDIYRRKAFLIRWGFSCLLKKQRVSELRIWVIYFVWFNISCLLLCAVWIVIVYSKEKRKRKEKKRRIVWVTVFCLDRERMPCALEATSSRLKVMKSIFARRGEKGRRAICWEWERMSLSFQQNSSTCQGKRLRFPTSCVFKPKPSADRCSFVETLQEWVRS